MLRARRRNFPGAGEATSRPRRNHPRLPASVGSHIFGGRCASLTGIHLHRYRGDSYHPWRARRHSWRDPLRYAWWCDALGHRSYSLCGYFVAARRACVDCGFMGSSTAKGPDARSVGDNTRVERENARRNAANWVRRQYPQQWDVSCAELAELVATLGLWEKYDPPAGVRPTQRTKITDCGPVPVPRA